MTYTPIVGTLGYVLSPCGRNVLLVHRNLRPDDDHYGFYNGLGGKLHRDESVADGMKREIYEEAGITVEKMRLRGTINWTNFGPKTQDWLGFIFVVDAFCGSPHEKNAEGTLAWHRIDTIHTLPMWEGDRHFLPLVFGPAAGAFHGYMPYEKMQSAGFYYEWLN